MSARNSRATVAAFPRSSFIGTGFSEATFSETGFFENGFSKKRFPGTRKGRSRTLLCLGLVLPGALALAQIPEGASRDMTWPDIEAAHGVDLNARGWDKRYVLDTFDHDHDGALDPEEQRMLVVSLDIREPGMSSAGLNTSSQGAASAATTSPQQASASSATPEIHDVAPRDLPGQLLLNGEGERLGKVDRVVMDRRAGALGLVIRSGGFLGLGGERAFVPLADIALNEKLDLVWQGDGDVQRQGFEEERYRPVDVERFGNLHSLEEELIETARRDQ